MCCGQCFNCYVSGIEWYDAIVGGKTRVGFGADASLC